MRRGLAITAAVVVALVLVVELAAIPVATRVVGSALARCLPYESVQVLAVDRPVTPGLLLGRVGGVELAATGLELGELRVDEAQLALDPAVLPWAVGSPPATEAQLTFRVLAADLEGFLAATVPFGLAPEVELVPGEARLSVPPVPASVAVTATVRDDGTLLLTPAAGVPAWWERLGLAETIELPSDVRFERFEVATGRLEAQLRVDGVAGVDGGDGCDGPLTPGA